MSHTTLMFVMAGLAASAVTLGGLAMAIYRETQRTVAFDRRLMVPRRLAIAAGLRPEREQRRKGDASSPQLGMALARAGSMLAPVGAAERQKLAQMIRMAGFAQRDALSVFLSLKLASAMACGAVAWTWASESERLGQYGYLVAVAALVGFVVGGVWPEYGLRALVARRSRRMAGALPDALDLTVMCLESGLTFERAIATVAEELMPIEPNLAGELRLMETELRVGTNRRAVLQEFYDRAPRSRD